MRLTGLISAFAIALAAGSSSGLAVSAAASPTNVDVSQRHTNESEEAIAVNPTNPKNIVMVTNVDVPAAGMFEGVSFDGGKTWTTSLIGNNDNLGAACCDPSLSFDNYGNLFLAYLYNVGNFVPVALSTDGGLHFNLIANIAKPASSSTSTASERKGLFRFVDQPTITAAHNEVWTVFNGGGPIVATGAAVKVSARWAASARSSSSPGRTIAPMATSPSARMARS